MWRRFRVLWRLLLELRRVGVTIVAIPLMLWGASWLAAWGEDWLTESPADTLHENTLRYAGLGLQLLGLGTVAWGIHSTRKLFGRPSFWTRAHQWLTRLRDVVRGPQPRRGSGSVVAQAGLRAAGDAPFAVAPGVSVEERLAALEANQQRLQNRANERWRECQEDINSLREDLASEAANREQSDQQINKQLEEFSVGGLHLESMGLIWILLGIIIATVPGEIAKMWLKIWPNFWLGG